MQAMETSNVNGTAVFIVITIISIGFAITMSLVASEFPAPSKQSGEMYVRISLPLVVAVIAVLTFIAFGVLYSSQKVTTLY